MALHIDPSVPRASMNFFGFFFFSFLTKSIGWNGVAIEQALDKA